MLDGAPILIVEDEPFIAMDLAAAVWTAGGLVVGPAATVRAGLTLLAQKPVAAAILDCNLLDGEVSPLATALLRMGTPLIVYTASSLPKALAAWEPQIPVIKKPTPPLLVVARLAVLIKK